MNTDVMFSKKSDEWQTPPDLYNFLNHFFEFKLDPCTTKDNPLKTKYYFTKEIHLTDDEEDGLNEPWPNVSTFVNPPYSEIKKWITKIKEEWQYRLDYHSLDDECSWGVKPIVILVPARVDTQWFEDITNVPLAKVMFIKGRLKFGGSESGAPFPSCLIILSCTDKDYKIFSECATPISCYKLNLKKG